MIPRQNSNSAILVPPPFWKDNYCGKKIWKKKMGCVRLEAEGSGGMEEGGASHVRRCNGRRDRWPLWRTWWPFTSDKTPTLFLSLSVPQTRTLIATGVRSSFDQTRVHCPFPPYSRHFPLPSSHAAPSSSLSLSRFAWLLFLPLFLIDIYPYFFSFFFFFLFFFFRAQNLHGGLGTRTKTS